MSNTGNSGQGSAMPTPELYRFTSEVIGGPQCLESLTLRDLREKLLSDDIIMSGDGELMFPLDRQSLINELDELIDKHGQAACAKDVIVRK